MSGILATKKANQLSIFSPVPLFKAWRLYNIQKVALGSLVVSRHLFEGLKKVYSNQSCVSIQSTLANLYSKVKGWTGLALLVLLIPIVIILITKHGAESP